MRVSRLIPTLLALALLSNAATAATAGNKLPALSADPTKTSTSGLSSGAFMAVQYDVAFSASTIGVGVVAGGPYNCFGVTFNILTCMQGAPKAAASYAAAQSFALLGQIDSVDHLASQKIYMFSGTNDPMVKQSVMNAVWDFFKAAKVPDTSIQYVKQFPAGHAFISADFGNLCPTTESPFIDECAVDGANYDQPNAILTQIYGPLHPKSATLSSAPMAFDQREFASPLADMADTGYVYIPSACQKGGTLKCAVHVVFHGCSQSADTDHVGDAVYGKLGYNAWADSNGIIVLYPQVNATIVNPNGCWDWFAYTGPLFQVKTSPQLSAVRAMVMRLMKN
jgi:poly(3-hydroxybutyrate) depolymerase